MSAPVDVATTPLHEILAHVRAALAAGADVVWLRVLDPDRGRGCATGERVDGAYHRPLRVWVELADRLGLRLRTPVALGDDRIAIGLERLGAAAPVPSDPRVRYAPGSEFARLDKREEPGFLLDLADALARARLPPRPRVLELGVNTGDALVLARELRPELADAALVGVDHSAEALAVAAARLGPAFTGVAIDLSALPVHDLGRFDLVLAIGTLQSPGVDDRALLRHVVQARLTPTGAVILGVPNCRYRDGELLHGARMRNFTQPELGLVVKDVAFYRKYLQQHDREVFVTGHHDLFVTGAARAR